MIASVVLWCSVVGASQEDAVLLPPGQTRLADLGGYRVGYVYTDGRSGVMPPGWTGHFHGTTGISYTVFGHQDGKECLLIHCPWRRGTGITYAEYVLQLPEIRPIVLELSIAMKNDVARPDRSDGCQFRVCVRPAGGSEQVLVNEHYARAEWKPFRCDLTPHAGRQILLRLETGPGPKGNASWDYAFFGDPQIVVGEERTAPPFRPIWDLKGDLKRLSNRQDIGCCPTGPLTGERRFGWDEAAGSGVYEIDWPTDKARITYTVRTRREGDHAASSLIDATAVISTGDKIVGSYRVGLGSGVVLSDGRQSWEPDAPEVKVRLIGAQLSGESLHVETEHTAGPITARVTGEYAVRGSSLMVTMRSKDPVIGEVRFGSIAAPRRRSLAVPYLGLGPVWHLPDAQMFASIVLDWTCSDATHHDALTAHYLAKTDGTRNPVVTTAYVTFSPRIGEVFCNIPHPPSPFLEELAGRVMFDVWGGRFRDDARWFAELATYGVAEAAIIKHDWQRSGYDNALPNHYPANPDRGGDEDMTYYIQTTRDLGHRTSLHENYVDFYPNSELYDPNDVSLGPDGQPIKAWFNAGTGIQSFAVKPTAMLKYARMQSPEIHRRYGTNAAYLDVHSCVPPWFHVDHRAGEPGASTFAAVYKAHAELFAFERQTHQGPLFGEGNHHFFWAGLCDGTEAQVEGGENAPWLLDFDLLKIHPQMVNHGMGYLERWLASGYGTGWHSNIPSTADLDKYRAMELAFGHAGFVANQVWHQLPFVLREFYLVTPIQRRYVTGRPIAILYDVNGQMLPVSAALGVGPLSNRVYIEYDNGLKLWCNGSRQDWAIPSGPLCAYGFRAEADQVLVTTTYWPTNDGTKVVADYREADGLIYADARAFEPKPSVSLVEVTPTVSRFEPSGPRKFKITYQWEVRRDPVKDWRCFVHFVPAGAGHTERIAFQNDHLFPQPVSQWKAGQTIADGPYEVTVPDGLADGDYALTIGLFDDSGRAKLPFVSEGDSRYPIGTLTVKGTQLTLAPRHLQPLPVEEWMKRRQEHTNPTGAVVDFGTVVTNGCVVIRPMYKSWWVTVYPREQAFRIRLRTKRLDPKAPAEGWTVQMVNINRRNFGLVPLKVEDGWIEWQTGQPGMVYYCVAK